MLSEISHTSLRYPFPAMQASDSFKQALLKHMLVGLQAGGAASSKNMTLLERKRAVKLSADIAVASARGGGANWSHAVIADISREDKNKVLLRKILGREYQSMARPCYTCKVVKSKKIVRRSLVRRVHRRIRKGGCSAPAPASCGSSSSKCNIARRVMKKRIQVLRSLVPGGESLDGYYTLLGEALDYVISLKAQVDIMQHLTNSVEILSGSCSGPVRVALQERKGLCVEGESTVSTSTDTEGKRFRGMQRA